MKKAPAFIAALLALMTAGCVLSGKGKKPVPPAPVAAKPAVSAPPAPAPQPLSTPQTQVQLPPFQPVDPAAYAVDAPPQVEVPEPPPAPRPTTTTRRAPSGGSQPSRTESPPATTPAVPEPAAAPPIQEIVPAAEVKRLQEQAQARRRDVQQILDQLSRRQLGTAQRDVVTTINSLLLSSSDAEKRGDMKTADSLADRAQVLARDLINGK